jgi:hypothetical protein
MSTTNTISGYDHALTLEFEDKLRLAEFFEKSREVFPDSAFETGSLFESGDHAIAEGGFRRQKVCPRFHQPPRSCFVAGLDDHVENGKIVQMVGILRSKQSVDQVDRVFHRLDRILSPRSSQRERRVQDFRVCSIHIV